MDLTPYRHSHQTAKIKVNKSADDVMKNENENENEIEGEHEHPTLKADSENITITYKSYNYKLDAPEGRINVFVLEADNGKPVRIMALCGKAGAIINAWLDAFCRVVSNQMERGLLTISDLMHELSSTTSDNPKINYTTGMKISSGPEAIFVALLWYQKDKYEELADELGFDNTHLGQASIGRVD